MHDNGDDKYWMLRKKAEDILKSKNYETREIYTDNIEKLVEELTIRQLELEMQNNELQLAFERIEHEKAKYIDLYENAPNAYFTLTSNGNIVFLNHAAANMLQYPIHAINRTSIFPFLHSKSKTVFTKFIKRVFQNKEMESVDVDFVDREQNVIHTKLQAIAFFDKDYKDYLCRCSATDFTKEVLIQRKLEFSEARFRAVLDMAQIGIAVFNADGDFLMLNKHLSKIIGFSEDEILGKSFFEIVHQDDQKRAIEFTNDLVANKIQDISVELRFVHKYGKVIWTELGLTISRGPSNDIEYLIAALHDITDRKENEIILKQNKENLKEAQRIGNMGHWEIEITSLSIQLSKQLYHICDIDSSSDMVNLEQLKKLIHPDDENNFYTEFFSCISENRKFEFIHRIITPSGKLKYVNHSAILQFNEKNEPVRCIGTIQDITALKETEMHLRESEAKLKAIFSSLPDMIFIQTSDGKYLDYYIPNKVKTYVNPEAFLGKYMHDIFPKHLADKFMEVFQEVAQTQTIREYEYTLLMPDGEFFYEARAVWLDENRIMTIVRDISLHKKMEREIKDNEFIFRSVIDTSPLAIYISSGSEQRAEYINPTFTQLFGYTIHDISSVSEWMIVAYPEESYRNFVIEEWNKRVLKAIQLKAAIEPMETIITCKNGEKKVVSWGFVSNGSKNWAFGVDLTFIRNAETELREYAAKLKESNVVKDKFLSIVSHDLKSPFNAMIGLTELLMRKHTTFSADKTQEILRAMHGTAKNSFSLLENLLTWARAQTGKLAVCKTQFDIKILLADTISLYTETAELKHVKLLNDTDAEPVIVFADVNMIKTSLRNLISNAIKYSKKGGKVTFSLEVNSEFAVLSVRDFGVGMSTDVIESLFRPDSVSSNPGTAGETGTGLGLILVHEFAILNGGEIRVKSETDLGSVFLLSIPLAL